MNIRQYQTVEPYREPSGILNDLQYMGYGSEMEVSELSFLCGLVRVYKPKKVVEVGVAAGGTTAVLIDCIHKLNLDCKVYSVDLSDKYYRDLIENRKDKRKTGFLLNELDGHEEELGKHFFLTGKSLAERLEEIGSEIDFLILDTTHAMPGELLDFIAALPYLAQNAVVVLHDVVFQHKQSRQRRQPSPVFCTALLFQTVTADKFLNHQEIYPNIGAFKINEDTIKYAEDLFAALMIAWSYMPEKEQLEKYKEIIEKHYSADCVRLFCQAVLAADTWHNWSKENEKTSEVVRRMMLGIDRSSIHNILLYGAGKRGHALLALAKEWGIEINGFIISDNQKKTGCIEEIPVYVFSQISIKFNRDDTLIIQTADSIEIEYRLRQLNFQWFSLPEAFWKIYV